MTAFMLIPGLLLFLLSGHVVLRLVDRRGEAAFSPVQRAGVSFMVGLGAVTLQMFLYSLLSVPFGTALIAAPWIALGVATCFVPALKSSGVGRGRAWATPASIVLLVVICSQVLYSAVYTLSVPLAGWDAWFIWFVKARAFFLDRGVEASFLTDPVYSQSHPEYPLLVPLAVSWLYTAAGVADEWVGKALYPAQFAAMLAVLHYGVERATGSAKTALVFTALLAVTPIVLVHAAGFPVLIDPSYAVKDVAGYADLTLGAYFLAAGIFIFLHARDGGVLFAVLASVMLAMGAWTKNEGLTFALIGFVLLVATVLVNGKSGRGTLVFIIIPLALFIVPWAAYKSALGLGSEYVENMGAGVVLLNIGRLGVIVPYVADYIFLKPGVTGLVWWAYVVSTVLCLRHVWSSRAVFLHLLVLGQLAAYIFVYIITPVDLKWHLSTSLDRLVLHLIPLGTLVAAMNLAALAGAPRQRR